MRHMALFSSLAAGLLSCSGSPPPDTTKVNPIVTLHPLPREVLGTGLTAVVEVSGCDRVSRVRLRDRDVVFEEVEASGAETTLQIPANHLPLAARGVAADLALYAEADCDDGRTGSSRESPVTFMPAEQLLAGPWEFGQNFWIEPGGRTFLTCTNELVRWSMERAVVGRAELNFECSANTQLTFGADGSIHVLEPGLGFASFTDELQPELALTIDGLEQLLVPPGATQPLVALVDNGVLRQLFGLDPASGARRWGPVDLGGLPAGKLSYYQGRALYPSYWLRQTGSDLVDLGLQSFDVETGAQSSQLAFGTAEAELMGPLTLPELSLDSSATTAYFSDISNPAIVRACDATAPRGCTELGGGLVWRSSPLIGGVARATRTATALIAWGDRVAYFLNPANGTTIGEAVTPAGSLVFTAAIGSSDGATFLLAQAPDEAGIKQLLVFDAPGALVADYLTGTEGFIVDVDRQGRAWLWSYDLARLFTAGEYRRVLSSR